MPDADGMPDHDGDSVGSPDGDTDQARGAVSVAVVAPHQPHTNPSPTARSARHGPNFEPGAPLAHSLEPNVSHMNPVIAESSLRILCRRPNARRVHRALIRRLFAIRHH